MALSVVDLYRDVLPKTNCGDCGFPSCLAFASMVVSAQHPLKDCPHVGLEVLTECSQALNAQYAAGKWTQRDLAEDALQWAQKRSASMRLADLPGRIGGTLINDDDGLALNLPYFNTHVVITSGNIVREDGTDLTRWEQVLIHNHLAQGGRRLPTGTWKGFEEFPNTVSKVKTMASQVEIPLVDRFHGRPDALIMSAGKLGGHDTTGKDNSADIAFCFDPFPRVPILLLFWDEDLADGFGATAKLLFDETVPDHLDIESIVFLSERLRQMLCDADGGHNA